MIRRPTLVPAGVAFFLACWQLLCAPVTLWSLPIAERLAPLPAADLSSIEPGVRQRVEGLRQKIEQATKADDLTPSELAEGYGRLGQYYLAYDYFEAAGACFANALQLAPGDRRWTYYVGIIEQAAGRLEAAVSHFRQVLKTVPDDSATLVRLGRALADLGQAEAAAEVFARAAGLEDSRAAGRFGLGKLAAKAGEHAAAVEHFEAILKLAPEASMVHYPLGQAYRRLGDLDRARAELAQRGPVDVPYEDPLGNAVAWLKTGTAFEVLQALARDTSDQFSDVDFLGFALTQLSGVEGAVEKLAEVLRLRGAPKTPEQRRENARVHYVLGGLLVDRGADLRALEQFQTAVELDPSLLDAGIKLGNVLVRQQRFEQAEVAYSKVLTANPQHRAALLKRAALWMSQQRFSAAIDDLEKLTKIDPDGGEVWVRLATSYQLSGNAEGAERAFSSSLGVTLTATERVGALFELGNLALARGQLEEAAGHYREVLGIEPASPRVSFALAGVLGRQGHFAAAAEQYEAVTNSDPQNSAGWRGAATALILAGNSGAARERLEAGLAVLPDDLELQHTLARLLAASPNLALRDGDRAFDLAIGVFNSAPTFTHGLTVAMALAQAGRYEEAVRMQQELLDQAAPRGDFPALAQARQHLQLYREGRACCG